MKRIIIVMPNSAIVLAQVPTNVAMQGSSISSQPLVLLPYDVLVRAGCE